MVLEVSSGQKARAQAACSRTLEVPQTPELLLHLLENKLRNLSERSPQASVVDRSALVDHDLAIGCIARHATGQRDPQQILSRQSGGTRENPGGGVIGLIEEIRLDHQYGSQLAGLGSLPRAQIGEVECAVANCDLQSSPSSAR